MLPGYLVFESPPVFFLNSWLTAMNEGFLILNHWITQLDPWWVESINKFAERIGGVWDTQKQRKYIHSLRCHVGPWPSASGALCKLIKTTSHCDPKLPPPKKKVLVHPSATFSGPLHFPYFKPSLALAKLFQTFHWIIGNPNRRKPTKSVPLQQHIFPGTGQNRAKSPGFFPEKKIREAGKFLRQTKSPLNKSNSPFNSAQSKRIPPSIKIIPPSIQKQNTQLK